MQTSKGARCSTCTWLATLSRWKFSTYRNRAKQGLKQGETYDIKRELFKREFPRKRGLNDTPSEVSRTHFAKGNVISVPQDFSIGLVLTLALQTNKND
jgi:hypothetical protein